MDRDEFDIEQYRALRSEILRSMEDGNQIIGFGIAAIALVAHAGVSTDAAAFQLFVFALVVPLLAAVVASMWFAAQERTARASHFLSGVEKRLARDDARRVMWEDWLRHGGRGEQTKHFWSTEHAAFALFGIIVLASVAFSVTVDGRGIGPVHRIVAVAFSTVLCALIAVDLWRRYTGWRAWLTRPFGALDRDDDD